MSFAGAVRIATVMGACLAFSAMPALTRAAEIEGPNAFVSLKFQGACDAQNNRLFVANVHTFKTIAVTIRWKATGGKDLVEQFFTAPNSLKEIGCAAEAEITDVTFSDF